MELSKISQKCPLYESNGNTVPKVCTVLYSMHCSRLVIFDERDLKKDFLHVWSSCGKGFFENDFSVG
jgi:hypothetical protein